MHGNIWEWCQDWYDAATYRKEGNKDPQCRQLGVSRVLRGGSWANDPGSCRFSFRDWNDPAEHDDVFGFRVCYAPIAPLVETLTSPPAQLSVPVIQPRTAQQRAPQRLAISPDELAALFKIEIPAADAEQGRLIIRDWNDQTYRSDSDGSQVYFPSQAPKVETLPVVGPAALQVVPPTQKGAPPVVVPPPKAVPQPTTTKEVPAATVAPLKPKEVPPPVVVQSPEALPPSHCFTIPEWGSLPLDVVQPPKALPQPKVILPAPPLSTRTSGDVLTVPGVEMKFAWIPPGSFHMGGAVHEDEKPIREVTLSKGYFMGVVPVTQAQWCRVMGDDSRPSHFRGDDRPVENVSWRDCQAFLVELCKRIDKPFCLPTEAEWEYACRAGSGVITNFCNGGGKKALRRVGWYEGNSDGQTHPVGQKEPNSWGLYDMHGNVWEWCQDWHDTAYYQKADNKDPQGSPSGTHRVLRGGCWCDAPVACRAAFRNWSDPAEHDDVFGFRVCFAWTS